jgi:hypothetical protein
LQALNIGWTGWSKWAELEAETKLRRMGLVRFDHRGRVVKDKAFLDELRRMTGRG